MRAGAEVAEEQADVNLLVFEPALGRPIEGVGCLGKAEVQGDSGFQAPGKAGVENIAEDLHAIIGRVSRRQRGAHVDTAGVVIGEVDGDDGRPIAQGPAAISIVRLPG